MQEIEKGGEKKKREIHLHTMTKDREDRILVEYFNLICLTGLSYIRKEKGPNNNFYFTVEENMGR